MASELELKLRCTEYLAWEGLMQALSATGVDGVDLDGRAKSKQLNNTYFDTPSLALNKARIALRLRTKAGRLIQTLKTAGQSINGLHQRGEWEWVLGDVSEGVDMRQLDLSLLNALPQWDDIATSFDAKSLVPVFSTNFHRTECVFTYKGLKLELVLDQGSIEPLLVAPKVSVGAADGPTSADSSEAHGKDSGNTINEVEIELLSAESGIVNAAGQQSYAVEVISELADALTSALPLQRYDISKAQRGYALLDTSS